MFVKDLDEDRSNPLEERAFKIAGETFKYYPAVSPRWLFMNSEITGDLPGDEILHRIDGMIGAMLTTDTERKRWESARERDKNPLTLNDLVSVRDWLVEEQTGRPPTPAVSSSNGSATTGTPSTETAFTELDAASTA